MIMSEIARTKCTEDSSPTLRPRKAKPQLKIIIADSFKSIPSSPCSLLNPQIPVNRHEDEEVKSQNPVLLPSMSNYDTYEENMDSGEKKT